MFFLPLRIVIGGFLSLFISLLLLSNSYATQMHTIKSGETLGSIALIYYNDNKQWRKIYDANRHLIKQPHLLSAGWVLTVPELKTPKLDAKSVTEASVQKTDQPTNKNATVPTSTSTKSVISEAQAAVAVANALIRQQQRINVDGYSYQINTLINQAKQALIQHNYPLAFDSAMQVQKYPN